MKQQFETDAKRIPGPRLLPGRFIAIHEALRRHAIEGAAVAPAGGVR